MIIISTAKTDVAGAQIGTDPFEEEGKRNPAPFTNGAPSLERFTAAIEQARAEGFRGPNALKRAQAILWPKQESSVIDTAISNDDVEFMEKCVLNAFEVTDPIYIVGMSYYTTRKKISDITRELQKLAPWLTADQSRERVKWCLKIFQGKAFLAARKNLRS
ncbi:hypothetical protein [Klebsiella electrica]|uniref:hypothetical protein n=1 Tax=Klebsiella electrica TaxID=1259973 RepID=UPI001D197BE2|nr:hypothetical protein [Klebsiella electrica]